MHALRLVTTSQVFNRRRSKRCILEQRTTGFVRFGEQLGGCVIEDISLGGARLRFDDAPPEGEAMILEHIVAGCFPGRIVWTKGNVAGFRFDQPERPLERELQCVALMIGGDDTQSVRRPVP
jgi:hypothetical protein